MRNIISVIAAALITIVSCGNKTENNDQFVPDFNNPPKSAVPAQAVPVEDTKIAESSESKPEGLQLIEKADCLACHKMDAKLIGPSYQEVADKYTESDLEILAEKIIEGGKGNWGDVPMTPHPTVTKDEAKTMVKYILSLKK